MEHRDTIIAVVHRPHSVISEAVQDPSRSTETMRCAVDGGPRTAAHARYLDCERM
jgi:hypothetical protein